MIQGSVAYLKILIGLGFLLLATGCTPFMPNADFAGSSSLSSVYCSSASTLEAQKASQNVSSESNSKVRLNFDYLQAKNSQFQKMNAKAFARMTQAGIAEKTQIQSEIVLPSDLELIAKIDKDCADSLSEGSLSRDLLEKGEAFPNLRKETISFFLNDPMSLEELSGEMDEDPCILVVSEQQQVQKTAISGSNDRDINRQSHLDQIGFYGATNKLLESDVIDTEIVIAVVDTGVDYGHDELRSQMWEDPDTGVYGQDFHNGDFDPMDDNGHGTHVAGLAAATYKNGTGGSGAMGRYGRIMAIKSLDNFGGGSIQNVVNGIDYAIQNNADIINMSLGAAAKSASLEASVRDAISRGIVVVSASGNSGVPLNDTNFFAPAGYAAGISGLISVGSIDVNNGRISSFSNYGASTVEIAAPGSIDSYVNEPVGLWSTVPRALVSGPAYSELNGTSMATPLVSGSIGLLIAALKSNGISYTPSEVEAALLASANTSSALSDYIAGGRSLNSDRLAQVALNAIASGSLCR